MANQPTVQMQQQVAELYLSMLNRNPDAAGFAFWVNGMANGQTQAQIAIGFSHAPEFDTVAGMTPVAAVQQLYQNILGRAVDANDPGVVFWSNGIAGYQNTGLTYREALGQIAVNIASAAFGQGNTTADGQYVTATVNAAIFAATHPTETYTLTPGIDTFVGSSSNNNVFVASDTPDIVGVPLPAFTPLDSLTGNGLNNTFNISYQYTSINTLEQAPNAVVTGIQTANFTVSSGNDIIADTNEWTGLTTLNSTAVNGVQAISAAQTTNVTTTNISGDVYVNGGNAVSITTSAGEVLVGQEEEGLPLSEGDAVTAAGAISVVVAALADNVVRIDGGTAVSVTATGVEAENCSSSSTYDIIIGNNSAPTGTVTVTDSVLITDSNSFAPAISVTGGSSVSITRNLSSEEGATGSAGGVISVNGNTQTTVTITQNLDDETAAGTVLVGTIDDGSGSISTVNLTNFGDDSYVYQDADQTLTLNLEGDGGTIGIGSYFYSSLTLNLTDFTGSTIGAGSTASGFYSSVSVSTNGSSASTVTALHLDRTSALAISGANGLSVTTLTLSGGNNTITSTNSGGVTISSQLSNDTAFNGAASSGNDTIILGATNKTITLGGGNDRVTLNSGTLGGSASIDGGVGGTDTLVMTAANAATLSAAVAPITNFEVLNIGTTSGDNTVTINLANLGNINQVTSSGTAGVPGAPSAQVETWTAPALLDGQSVTIDGLTVTAYANSTADQVAYAIETGQSIDGFLTLTGTADPEWTIERGPSNVITFTNISDGPQAALIATAGRSAVLSGDSAPVVTNGTSPTTASETFTFASTPTTQFTVSASATNGTAGSPEYTKWNFGGKTMAAGESLLLDGKTLTVTSGTLADSAIATALTSSAGTYSGYTISGSFATPSGWTGTPLATVSSNYLQLTNTVNGAVTDYTGSAVSSLNVADSGGVGSSWTINGQVVTVLSSPTSITTLMLAQAFADGNTASGKLAISGTNVGGATGWVPTDNANGTLTYTYGTASVVPVTTAPTASAAGAGNVAPTVTSTTNGSTGTYELNTFTAVSLLTSQTITVNGLTFEAKQNVTAAQVAAAVVTGQNGGTADTSLFIQTGTRTITTYTASAESAAVTFTATSVGDVAAIANITTGGGNAADPSVSNASLVGGTGIGTAPLVLTGYTSGGALTLTGNIDADVQAIVTGAQVSQVDSFNLTLSKASAFGGDGSVYLPYVETVNILSTGGSASQHHLNLVDASAKTINVSGGSGIDINFDGTALTLFDASGVTAGNVTFTTAALASAATIKGGAAGTNIINFSLATQAVTYVGGTGIDIVDATNANNNIISTSDGNDIITVGSGDNTIVAGNGNDIVALGSGANTVDLGAGNDAVLLGANMNVVTLGSGDDIVDVVITTNGNTYSSIVGAGAGDVFAFASITNDSASFDAQITLAPTAAFRDFLDAAAAGSTSGTAHWFQYGGNTYIVDDYAAQATFQDGIDTVVQLVGLVDLSTATVGGNAITIA